MAQEAKNKTNISSSDPLLDKGWFTVRDCYQSVDIHPLPLMEPLNSKEKHLIAMAFYSILYLGKRPANFPHDLGGALAIFLYNNLLCGRMYEAKRRAFLSAEGLPTDVQEQFTPKCGIPTELMDTASGLKAWASDHILALDLDEGLQKAFEESGKTHSRAENLSTKVGEAVALQLHPEKSAGKYREYVELLSASIFRNKSEDSLIKLFAFFLRLVVQTPNQLIDYYADAKKRDEMVTGWAELYESKSSIKVSFSRKFLYTIHGRLVALRPAITNHVAIGLAHVLAKRRLDHPPSNEDSAALAYQELTKWFALRMEYYGLALLRLPCKNSHRFEKLEDIKNALRLITTTTNVAQMVGLLAALLIYNIDKNPRDQELDSNKLVTKMAVILLRMDEEDEEKKYAHISNIVKIVEKIVPNHELPKFNEYDRNIGQFAKCFSPKYMPWLSFNFNRETSALLLRGIYPATEYKSAATEPNGHEKWTYVDKRRIKFYRKDPLIHPKFLEALETVQNDILYSACKQQQDGSLRMELIGLLIGQALLDEEDEEGESDLWKEVTTKIKQENEDNKEEKRRLLRAKRRKINSEK